VKKLLMSISLVALMAAGSARADATSVQPQDLFRFNVNCEFDKACTAQARIFLDLRTADSRTAHPDWFGNLLSVTCLETLISASDAQLFRVTGEDSVRWEIFNADGTVEIDLKDHPFADHPTNVDATLEFDHQKINGKCYFTPKEVHNRN
jgi:hypothetical protein